jgi:hypothetical protein
MDDQVAKPRASFVNSGEPGVRREVTGAYAEATGRTPSKKPKRFRKASIAWRIQVFRTPSKVAPARNG